MHTILAFLTIAAWVALVVSGFSATVTIFAMVRHFYRLENDFGYRLRWDLHRLHGGSDIRPRLLGKIAVALAAVCWIVAVRVSA